MPVLCAVPISHQRDQILLAGDILAFKPIVLSVFLAVLLFSSCVNVHDFSEEILSIFLSIVDEVIV